jgi:hypothetical protein
VRRHFVIFVVGGLLAAGVSAQETQPGGDHGKSPTLNQIVIEGKPITGDDVVVRKGTVYVSVPALERALGAKVVSQGPMAVLSIPSAPQISCGETADVMRLSDIYRKAAVRIPDAIEALRLLAMKPGVLVPAARFDDIKHQIDEADFRVKTNADKSVSYALSHSNNTLAIMYFRLRRGIPSEYAKQPDMDSRLCAIESKFALETGRLSGNESCSVFQSSEKQVEAKTAASN